jgi:bifunctional NMN adenylyltransferase/nudix hydrolase
MKKLTASVGVIIARFQVHELTSAHIDLVQTVAENHPKVIIFLGLSPCMVTQNNPLDFESRKQMLLEKFPNINVLYIKDQASDELWSKELDEKIGDLVGPNQTALLYGSRDSFIKYYTGKYATQELVQEVFVSGTELRRQIGKSVKRSADFRAGVIWASANRYDTCYPTVDVAIFNENYTKILLGRKSRESQYRFIGGFADPQSESYEADAKREVMEETGLEITNLKYIGSTIIQDFRYKNERDQIKTLFFICHSVLDRPQVSDDICEVRYFEINELKESDIIFEHKILFKMLQNYLKK